MHRSIFHASDLAIRPYIAEIEAWGDLGEFCRISRHQKSRLRVFKNMNFQKKHLEICPGTCSICPKIQISKNRKIVIFPSLLSAEAGLHILLNLYQWQRVLAPSLDIVGAVFFEVVQLVAQGSGLGQVCTGFVLTLGAAGTQTTGWWEGP